MRWIKLLICFEGAPGIDKDELIEAFCKSVDKTLPVWKVAESFDGRLETAFLTGYFALEVCSFLKSVDWLRNDLIIHDHPMIRECVFPSRSSVLKDKINHRYFPEGTCFIFLIKDNWDNKIGLMAQNTYRKVFKVLQYHLPLLSLHVDQMVWTPVSMGSKCS